ncbi:MAG: hypothetical protein K2Z25_19255 [Beijerinckiaceae bacterium]|nr:hypothetical protein [Beijerinckiaceae bacterium]
MTDDIANWDTDPAYRELKRKFDAGEITREKLLEGGWLFMRVQAAVGAERWKLMSEILATEEPDVEAALAIKNGMPGIPPK